MGVEKQLEALNHNKKLSQFDMFKELTIIRK